MKKLLCVVLSAVLLFSLVGCGSKDGDSDKKTESDPNRVVLNDFEDYKKCFEPLIAEGYFGKVNVNAVAAFVKSGKQSAKLEPSGDYTESATVKPVLRQPLNLTAAGIDCSDFSRVKTISCWIYNAEETELPVRMYLAFAGGISKSEKFTLKPGEWNALSLPIYPEALSISYDIEACEGLCFSFEPVGEGERAPLLYLDDITVLKSETAPAPYEITFEENELCSFDKLYQEYVVIPQNSLGEFDPVLSVNTQPAFVRSGYSLRCDFLGNDGTYTDYTYTGFSFSEEFVRKSAAATLSADDKIAFDVYNANADSQRLMISFYNTSGSLFYKNTGIYVNPGEWKTVELSVKEMNDYNMGGNADYGTKAMGEIYIHWDLLKIPTGQRTLYFDSFRFIKA